MEDERPMSDIERELLLALLAPEFPGCTELRVQARDALVVRADAKGSPALLFRVRPDAPRAFVSERVPVEARSRETDGTAIHCLLHVLRGQLSELEVYRENGESTEGLPDPDTLQVDVNVQRQ
jgi:hypothetical protein